MAFQLAMMVDLQHGTYAHARYDDLDLDARSQLVSRGKNQHYQLNYLDI